MKKGAVQIAHELADAAERARLTTPTSARFRASFAATARGADHGAGGVVFPGSYSQPDHK